MDGEDTMDTGREDVPNGHLMSTDVKICDDKAKGQDYYKRWVSKKNKMTLSELNHLRSRDLI